MNYSLSRRNFTFGLFATASVLALTNVAFADTGAEDYVQKLGTVETKIKLLSNNSIATIFYHNTYCNCNLYKDMFMWISEVL